VRIEWWINGGDILRTDMMVPIDDGRNVQGHLFDQAGVKVRVRYETAQGIGPWSAWSNVAYP
jgi:hypothetical protein